MSKLLYDHCHKNTRLQRVNLGQGSTDSSRIIDILTDLRMTCFLYYILALFESVRNIETNLYLLQCK